MRFRKFCASTPGRVLQVLAGGDLVWFGATDHTLIGLVTMMIGLVPVVTGLTNLWLLDDYSS